VSEGVIWFQQDFWIAISAVAFLQAHISVCGLPLLNDVSRIVQVGFFVFGQEEDELDSLLTA
jgi:hypothetical protein